MDRRTKIIAVVGSASDNLSGDLNDLATQVGRLIVDHRCRLVTGGRGGIMEAACKGARASAMWSDGSILGILPSYDRSQANPYIDIILPTGMGIARNTLVVGCADAVIAISGGSGTLSEIALAWQLGKPIVAVVGHGGWSEHMAGHVLDHRHTDPIHRAHSAQEAVELATQLSDQTRPEPGAIGSGWRTRGERS